MEFTRAPPVIETDPMEQLRPASRPALPPMGPDGLALIFDLDGTLAPIAPTPDAVRVEGATLDLLAEAGDRLDGRLAVVSGRPIAEIDRIVAGQVPVVAGIHGLEWRTGPNRVVRAAPHPDMATAVLALRGFAEGKPGLLIEDKGLAATLHYRNAPHFADEARHLAERIARDTGLVLQPGNMVVELRTPGGGKGDALAVIMAEPAFRQAVPYFFGDDLTDEDGFAAARRLGGAGVLVGDDRPSAAGYRLSGVDELLAWLRRFLDASTQDKGAR
jgi:trehalose 6-phosphate phosphatase